MAQRTGVSQVYWKVAETADRLTGEETAFLSEEELARLAGLRFEKRRDDWLLGRWTAKALLASSGVIPAGAGRDSVQIDTEPGGRPYAATLAGERLLIQLSISHSNGRALCALTRDGEILVGADIEKVEAKDAIFVEDYLGEAEREMVSRCPIERRDLLVTLAWSAKESLFKAMGTGLRQDTRRAEIRGLEDLVEGSPIPEGWIALEFAGSAVQRPTAGWWQRRENFVMTLVVLGTDQGQLIEC